MHGRTRRLDSVDNAPLLLPPSEGICEVLYSYVSTYMKVYACCVMSIEKNIILGLRMFAALQTSSGLGLGRIYAEYTA